MSRRSERDLQTITAQLRVTPLALARLLSVSGSQSDFILASTDGLTTVRVGLAVSSVPEAELTLGNGGPVLDWSRSTLAYGRSRVSVSRMELRLLIALLEFAPNPAPREHLVSRMWGPDSAKNQSRHAALAVWIFALRRRFAALGLPGAIRTVRSIGYAFVFS